MPLLVNDYKWRQTDNTVTIHVPLHGIHKSKVDLLTSDKYLKASFEQFHFEVFLFAPTDVDRSKCTINVCELIYELCKCSPGKWNELEGKLDKGEKKEVRRAAFEFVTKRTQEELEDKSKKRQELKRCSVSESVRIDSAQRERIEEIKTTEKTNALGDVEKWRSQKRKIKVRTTSGVDGNTSIPLPRNSQTLEVEFTARTLPTPSRESRKAEEDEWLGKQALARRSAGFASEDLRPEERNPQYILAKGKDFLRNRNYLGAISAYTYGIEISPSFVEFYIGRSQAQFELGNHHRVVKDCSKALELMKPEVDSNLQQRALCIGRRGMALHKLGLKRQAVDELKASMRLVVTPDVGKYLHEVLEEPEAEDEVENFETEYVDLAEMVNE